MKIAWVMGIHLKIAWVMGIHLKIESQMRVHHGMQSAPLVKVNLAFMKHKVLSCPVHRAWYSTNCTTAACGNGFVSKLGVF